MDRQFLSPKYWPTWVGVGILYALSKLPYRFQISLGSILAKFIYFAFRKRRHITEVNIQLCFPELSESEQAQLVKDTIRQNAIGIFETGLSLWADDKQLDFDVEIKGSEHLQEALQEGKGILLLSAHFSSLDLGGRLLSRSFPLDAMYRKHNNSLMDKIISEGRNRSLNQVIERKNIRKVLQALRKNHIVWYAPDQDFGPKNSVYAPFFGIEAATITATSRMVKLNGSPILMYSHHRKEDDSGYELEISPPIENFPSGDDIQDATAVNQAIEAAIRKHPDQYMWVHRRFKTHPQGKNYLYKKKPGT